MITLHEPVLPLRFPSHIFLQLLGAPVATTTTATLGRTSGVDEEAAFVLTHTTGALSVLSSAITVDTPQEAVVMGTRGSIKLHSPWWRPSAMTVTREVTGVCSVCLL